MSDAAYRLSDLGWLQFERLSDLVVSPAGDDPPLRWVGRADRGRLAVVDEESAVSVGSIRLAGPAAVIVIWSRPGDRSAEQLSRDVAEELSDLAAVASRGGSALKTVVISNLEETPARVRVAAQEWPGELIYVLGAERLGALLDGSPEVRAVLPSVLGIRDLTPLIDEEVRARSSFDLEGARDLARVFWPTGAYDRARHVLARHRFVVLTGPPEMGKTAIAQMLGLTKLTEGWEVHACSTPEALWSAHDRDRPQVFIADDAFGSTEYRADAAERWARALGRVLVALDDHHLLIWTSRPAPLKAGLGRIRRERGTERFPSPAQVMVDASNLELGEKTLILFRHAKARSDAGPRALVRYYGPSIVQHPYFTPERIRRLINDRLAALSTRAKNLTWDDLIRAMEHELAEPTEAMRTSYRGLEDEHRRILIALLDAPAGLIGERELAAVARRHHPAGLSRPMPELIDRLTDHFLRVTRLGIGWVHPSWRDLVIGELGADPDGRRQFLRAAGVTGVTLALSRAGGSAGERNLPLLVDAADWYELGDRLDQLAATAEDRELTQLLLALRETVLTDLDPRERIETEALAAQLLEIVTRRAARESALISGFLVDAWYSLNEAAESQMEPPALGRSWAELHPGSRFAENSDREALDRLDSWLALAQTLAAHDPHALRALGFFDHDQELLAGIIPAIQSISDSDLRGLGEQILVRIRRVAPRQWDAVQQALSTIELTMPDWWTPSDLAIPPSREPARQDAGDFTRGDIDRVLADLD